MDPMSNPYYQIYGVKGKTNKIYLRDGYSPQHQFKKGDTYKISVKCPDVGKVRKFLCFAFTFIFMEILLVFTKFANRDNHSTPIYIYIYYIYGSKLQHRLILFLY